MVLAVLYIVSNIKLAALLLFLYIYNWLTIVYIISYTDDIEPVILHEFTIF